jgi:hypothetical protein
MALEAKHERLNKERTKDLFKQTMHLLWIRDEPGPDVTRFLTTGQVSEAHVSDRQMIRDQALISTEPTVMINI